MRIGISGHQRLRPGSRDWAWIDAAMEDVARRHGINVVVSALAGGADQHFVRVAMTLGALLTAVIPCRDYADAFAEPAERAAYEALLAQAATIHHLDRPVCDQSAFMAAGEYVVAHCDLLVVLWDGQPSQGLGGTADVVACAARSERRVVHINPQNGVVAFR